MPLRPCTYLGCHSLSSTGRCDKHPHPKHQWQHRTSSNARGYGAQWQHLREYILMRDDGLCVLCLKTGRVQLAREVDHIVPKAIGGGEGPENLQSLCRACHRTKTAREGR